MKSARLHVTACLLTLVCAATSAQQLSIEDELFTYVLGVEGKPNPERGNYIKAQLKRFSIPFVAIPFDSVRIAGTDTIHLRGENIIGRLGRGPKRIEVGAHYDAVPGSPGANDNGSGVAVLLGLARTLRMQEWNYTVEFCFFDREEDGLIGSKFYLRRFVDRRTHLAMINLDVEGTGEEVLVGPVGGGDDRLLMPLVREAAKQTNVPYDEEVNYPESDEDSFAAAKLENISISVVPKGDGKRLAKMVRGEIHSKSDMPSVMTVMHTPNDTSREVSPDALKMSYEFTRKLLLLLNDVR